MNRRAFGVVMLAGVVSACGSSPPSHYYELSAQPEPQGAVQFTHPTQTVAVGAVKLPGALDRPQIARQIGPNQLEYAEGDRWAGPLDEMSRRVLAADLRPRLPQGTVLIDNDSSAPANSTVAVEVARFYADKTGRVTLDASWEVLDNNGKVIGAPREAKIVELPVGSDSAAVAATMSRAVATLAGNIAAGIGGEAVTAIR
jgi:uncharacterized lipoprotein YmbA